MARDLNIILYAVGFSIEESIQRAGCCISLGFEDEYGRRSNRTITHSIGRATSKRAHLQAAHLALASVVRPMRKNANVKLVCPASIKAILDKTDRGYSEYQKDDCDIINEVRKWVTFYNKLCFMSCHVEDLPGFDKAQLCAELQKGSDTNTVAT